MNFSNLFGKHSKWIWVGIIAIVILLLVFAIATYVSNNNYDPIEPGNTISNITNGGLVATDVDGRVYFINKHLYRLNEDDTVTRLTYYSYNTVSTSATVTSLAIYDGYIYYSNLVDGQKLYRMNLETLEDELVSEMPGKSINIVDGILYYAGYYGASDAGLYKIDLSRLDEEDGGLEQITIDWADVLTYYDGRIYFINERDLNKLYSIKLDGSDRQTLGVRATECFTFHEGWLYYGNLYGVYKCRPDGSNRTQLSDKRASELTVVDGYVYHCYTAGDSSTGNQEIYRTKITTPMKSEVVTSDTAGEFGVAGDYIYFTNMYKTFQLYRVSFDNTEFENCVKRYDLQ